MQRAYDLVMTHNLDADDLFIHRIQQFCAEARLNFFLVEPLWVKDFMDRLLSGVLWTRVLLNMHSEHHDPREIFHQVVRAASERGTHVIDPLDIAIAAFDKSRLHPRLVAAGVNVPFTIMVKPGEMEAFKLSETDRASLGQPFVIKPAMGYGRKGVILDATNEADLARSGALWRGDSYLLQKQIVPRLIEGQPAYFRVFFVFGAVFYCWWNCFTDQYRALNPLELKIHRLQPLEDVVRKVADLTGMTFFSSEIARDEAGNFVLIDYVNDQCHMLSQSSDPRIGVPDQLVTAIARQLVTSVKAMLTFRPAA